MERVVAVARECGYFDGVPPLLGPDPFDRLPRDKVLALATGSQGESRAALARIAEDEHPSASLAVRATASSSPRAPFPATRRRSARSSTALAMQGVEVVTDRTHLVHVSGHPRRAELARLYAWLKPKIAVPAHGEPVHLSEHVGLRHRPRASARSCAPSTATSCDLRRRSGRHRPRRPRPALPRTAKSCCRRTTIASPSAASSPSPASSRSRSPSPPRATSPATPTS